MKTKKCPYCREIVRKAHSCVAKGRVISPSEDIPWIVIHDYGSSNHSSPSFHGGGGETAGGGASGDWGGGGDSGGGGGGSSE